MVIDNFHVVRAVVFPCEADAPLIVNPDRMLSLAVSLQRLQPIARRRGEVFERRGIVDHEELVLRSVDQARWKAAGAASFGEPLGDPSFQGPDQDALCIML